jgi:2,5-diketo-D-gluconate reductase A
MAYASPMTNVPSKRLNDGRAMPMLGFGVWQVPDAEAESVVAEALRVGYRSIDTAQVYRNEAGVGRAVKSSGVARDDLFITTKLWNTDQAFDAALKAFDASLARLGLDAVDLYLVHWPSPHRGTYVEAWKALVRLREDGRARSIGVSNFGVEHLERILDATSVVPTVNQIELHPHLAQKELRAFHAKHDIATEAWSPLGQGRLLADETVVRIATKHGRSPAQVLLRWHLGHGLVAIPKSVTPSRIRENFTVFDFALDDEDVTALDALDCDGRVGPNPWTATF